MRHFFLHPVPGAIHCPVQIENFSDHGADHEREDRKERILPLERAADADIHCAKREPLHDDLLQTISNPVFTLASAGGTAENKAEKQSYGRTGENGGAIDKRTEQHGDDLTFRLPL